jgi:hypothetical protein
MSDAVDLRLLGENVRKLQEEVRGIKLALDMQSQTLAAQFGTITATLQAGLQQAAQVIGQHLAMQDLRIDSLTNVLREHIEETGKTLARMDRALAEIAEAVRR